MPRPPENRTDNRSGRTCLVNWFEEEDDDGPDSPTCPPLNKAKIERIVSDHLEAELSGHCAKMVDQALASVVEMLNNGAGNLNEIITAEINAALAKQSNEDHIEKVGTTEVASVLKSNIEVISNFTAWQRSIGERICSYEKKIEAIPAGSADDVSEAQLTKVDERLATFEEQIKSLRRSCLATFETAAESIKSLEAKLLTLSGEAADVASMEQVKEHRVLDSSGEIHDPGFEVTGALSDASDHNKEVADSTEVPDESKFMSKNTQMGELHYPMQYEFQESTWDLAAFLNLGYMNIADSILCIVTCCMTVFVQIVFILIVARSMTDEPLQNDELVELRQWRLSIGHRYEHYDEFSDSSLVARVCAGSMSLMNSGSQTSLYGNLDSFLGSDEPTGNWLTKIRFLNKLNGSVLCLLCFFLWTLNCQKEAALIYSFCGAILVKRTRRTVLALEDADFILEGISHKRMGIISVFSVLPRCCILGFLYVYGSLFLLYTNALSDLLLNALALGFILEIDDIIFEVFAPFSGKAVLKHVQPVFIGVVNRQQLAYKYVDVKSLATMIVIILLVLFAYLLVLQAFADHMDDAHQILCGGELNFVTVQSQATYQMYYKKTTPQDGSVELQLDESKFYANTSTAHMANIDGSYDEEKKWNYGIEKKHISFLADLAHASAQEAANLYTCYDQLEIVSSTEKKAIINLFNYLLDGVHDTCASMALACHSHNQSFAVRAVCPVTCQCDDPDALIYDLQGCPSSCMAKRQANANTEIRERSCQDLNVTYNETWKTSFYNFFSEYQNYLVKNNLYNNALTLIADDTNDSIASLAVSLGCNLTADLLSAGVSPNVCAYGEQTGTVTTVCPNSCGIDMICRIGMGAGQGMAGQGAAGQGPPTGQGPTTVQSNTSNQNLSQSSQGVTPSASSPNSLSGPPGSNGSPPSR